MARAAAIIKRAVSNGMTEVEVGRFPNNLCTDNGRAINQQEPGWENTLTGLPKEIYQFWKPRCESRKNAAMFRSTFTICRIPTKKLLNCFPTATLSACSRWVLPA